jgi:hypothetical protein
MVFHGVDGFLSLGPDSFFRHTHIPIGWLLESWSGLVLSSHSYPHWMCSTRLDTDKLRRALVFEWRSRCRKAPPAALSCHPVLPLSVHKFCRDSL